MSTKKFSELSQVASLLGPELFPLIQGGANMKGSLSDVLNYIQANIAALQAANNLSDVSSIPSSRANLQASHDRVTVTDKSAGFHPIYTDFQTTGVKTNPLYRCTASFTVTLDQDSTDSIPVGATFYGMTMSGFTTTFSAGSGATVETSSGGSTVVCSASAGFFLWSATKRAANTWSVQNGSPASGSFAEFPFFASVLTFTNMPSGAQEVAAGTTGRYRLKVDLTNFTSLRVAVSYSVVGATGAGFYCDYSTDQSLWTTIGTGTGTNLCKIDNATVGAYTSDWITIPAGAKGDVWLRGMGINGDGAADPVIGRISVQVK